MLIAPDFRTCGKRILVNGMSDPTEILENMADALADVSADGAWQLGPKFSNSRKCDVYPVSNSNSAHSLILKIYRQGATSEQAPGLQFRALERLEKSAPQIAAPRAIAFDADKRAILMERIDGSPIKKAFWLQAFKPTTRNNIVREIGKWLRAFHEISHIADQPLDGAKLARKLATQQQKHQQSGQNSSLMHGIKSFSDIATKLEVPTPHALLHGDFTTSNVLIGDNGPVGIDMWGSRMGPVFEDAARFISYAGINTPYALSPTPWHPDAALTQSLAAGYGKSILDLRSKSWSLILWYQYLRRWIVYSGRAQSSNVLSGRHWQCKRAERASLSLQSWLEDCL